LGLADPGDFRLGVDHPGHGIQVDVAGQAGDEFRHRDAFLAALVRQHRPAYAVTHGPDAFDAGVAVLVDDDAAAIIQLHAGAFGQQVPGGSATANGHQQLVHGQRLLAVLVGVGDVDRLLLDFRLRDFGA